MEPSLNTVPIDVREVGKTAVEAGKAILDIYRSDFEVTYKEDRSPLTAADQSAHEIIRNNLERLFPDIPLISEEGKLPPYGERKQWTRYWLVDPLDGTKEFIKKNDQFSVNIALIEGNRPVLGVIYAPVGETLYYATQEKGAWRQDRDGRTQQIRANEKISSDGLKILESHSHPSGDADPSFKGLKIAEKTSLGSSLKFCVIAEGKADVYVRQGPTWEWDTAAGQCLIEASGAVVLDLEGRPLSYNKPSLKNREFMVLTAPVHRFLHSPGGSGDSRS